MDIRRFFGGGNAAGSKAPSKTKATKKPTSSSSNPAIRTKKKVSSTPTKASKESIVIIDSDIEDSPIKVKAANNNVKRQENITVKSVILPTADISPSEKENTVRKNDAVDKKETKRNGGRDKSEEGKRERIKRDKSEKKEKSEKVNDAKAEKSKVHVAKSESGKDLQDKTELNDNETAGGLVKGDGKKKNVENKVEKSNRESVKADKEDISEGKPKSVQNETGKVEDKKREDSYQNKVGNGIVGEVKTGNPDNSDGETIPLKSKKDKTESNKAAKRKKQKFGNSKEVISDYERIEAEKTKKTNAKAEEKKQGLGESETKKRNCAVIAISSDEEDIFSAKRKNGGGAKTKKRSTIFDTDSDEDVIPPTQLTKKSKKKKPSNYVSDSDDEEQQISIMDAFKKVGSTSQKKTMKAEEKPKKPMCTMNDFFGPSTPVHRIERKIQPVKRKAESSPIKVAVVNVEDDDMEIHDDDDFEQTLLLLDTTQEEKVLKKTAEPEPSTSVSLASKLSSRIKEDHIWAEQTPERKKPRLLSENHSIAETPERVLKTSPVKASPNNKSPVKSSPRKKSPVKSSPRKKSPVKKSPLEMTPLVSPRKSPVKKSLLEMTPVVSPRKSPVKKLPLEMTPVVSPRRTPVRAVQSATRTDSTEKTPGMDDGTPTGGRGGPAYRSYLNRAPPQALGSKQIPEGEANCLEGLTFVITGVLESLERDDAKTMVERYGGKVTTSISKRTSYIVLGRDAGVSKTAKAEQFGTKQLDEDGLLNLVKTSKGKKSKYEIKAEAEAAKSKKQPTTPRSVKNTATPKRSPFRSQPSPSRSQPSPSRLRSSPLKRSASSASSPAARRSLATATTEKSEPSLMWVDKYKPTNLKQIIGQQGPKSNANKLLNWLRNWHRWQAEGRKPVFNRFNDDGAGYRAALLSGPPGVGKTTTSTLVCQEIGFSYVELNASDTRSKKSLETEVSELLGNHTLVDFFGGDPQTAKTHSKSTEGKMHCLIMEEVDGMAGNEDRGGMQELITLIKKSRIPIICMCNDRNHQKVRSLANYCFDLRFQRPRIEQIKAAMMSMAYKEGIKIPPPALNEVIAAANQDVRQVINNLSMWTAVDKSVTYDQMKKDAGKAVKDMKVGPFDVCRKVFVGGEETAKMTIHDKSDLFFHDYSLAPLFVHENYIHATPYAARGDKKRHLQCLSRAIDAIADGDLVDRQIRGKQNWSLLPVQAMYSSVIPGEAMRGGFSRMVQFPQWLGKNSSRSKTERILQELHTHTSLKVSGDRRALNMDYIPHFRRLLSNPLLDRGTEGVPEIISMLNDYDLLREDYDNILQISQWSHLRDPLIGVDPKTKAAFTRSYNKGTHLTPYSAVVLAKKGRGAASAKAGADADADMDLLEDQTVVENVSSDEDVEMFKAKKKPKGKSTVATTGSSRGRGRGKSTGKRRERGRGKRK